METYYQQYATVLGLLVAGVALVVVTHDPQLAARAHRQLRMRDGLVE